MENQFWVDSEHLSPKALEKKHRLENDPSSRKNHMEYMPGMEIIESDISARVMAQRNSYDDSKYTACSAVFLRLFQHLFGVIRGSRFLHFDAMAALSSPVPQAHSSTSSSRPIKPATIRRSSLCVFLLITFTNRS